MSFPVDLIASPWTSQVLWGMEATIPTHYRWGKALPTVVAVAAMSTSQKAVNWQQHSSTGPSRVAPLYTAAATGAIQAEIDDEPQFLWIGLQWPAYLALLPPFPLSVGRGEARRTCWLRPLWQRLWAAGALDGRYQVLAGGWDRSGVSEKSQGWDSWWHLKGLRSGPEMKDRGLWEDAGPEWGSGEVGDCSGQGDRDMESQSVGSSWGPGSVPTVACDDLLPPTGRPGPAAIRPRPRQGGRG